MSLRSRFESSRRLAAEKRVEEAVTLARRLIGHESVIQRERH
jgi:hypothetical protein